MKWKGLDLYDSLDGNIAETQYRTKLGRTVEYKVG